MLHYLGHHLHSFSGGGKTMRVISVFARESPHDPPTHPPVGNDPHQGSGDQGGTSLTTEITYKTLLADFSNQVEHQKLFNSALGRPQH